MPVMVRQQLVAAIASTKMHRAVRYALMLGIKMHAVDIKMHARRYALILGLKMHAVAIKMHAVIYALMLSLIIISNIWV